jgi:hypothetical protein
MPKTVALLIVLAAALATVPHAQSQSMPIGSITITSQQAYSCSQARNGADFPQGAMCEDGQLTGCPGVAGINFTFGYIAPASPKGTIVLFSGGKGTAPTEDDDNNVAFANSYASSYQVIEFEWAEPWENETETSSGGSILAAACRPATFLSYIYNTWLASHPPFPLCAQGASAGAAAIAYSMAWYGQTSNANNLTNVEMLAGPVLSEIDTGCNPTSPQATMCSPKNYCSPATGTWTVQETYVTDDADNINNWSGVASPIGCTSGALGSPYSTWASMSIVDGSTTGYTPNFNYVYSPTSYNPIHGWVCDTYASGSANNSGSEGNFFYNAVFNAEPANTNYTYLEMTGTLLCQGSEGVVNGYDPDVPGEKESQAITNDMNTKCVAP